MADLRNLRAPPPWNIGQNAYEDWHLEAELWENVVHWIRKRKVVCYLVQYQARIQQMLMKSSDWLVRMEK